MHSSALSCNLPRQPSSRCTAHLSHSIASLQNCTSRFSFHLIHDSPPGEVFTTNTLILQHLCKITLPVQFIQNFQSQRKNASRESTHCRLRSTYTVAHLFSGPAIHGSFEADTWRDSLRSSAVLRQSEEGHEQDCERDSDASKNDTHDECAEQRVPRPRQDGTQAPQVEEGCRLQ